MERSVADKNSGGKYSVGGTFALRGANAVISRSVISNNGAVEADQKLSTSPTINNDVLTGNGGANNLSGLAGNDLMRGLAGRDVLRGSDVLDGGPGNDVLDGGTGMDIATFAGNTAVIVDLSTKPATAKNRSEKDTLVSIEVAIGSSKADTFKGDGKDNEF